jgi:hypothetical protein
VSSDGLADGRDTVSSPGGRGVVPPTVVAGIRSEQTARDACADVPGMAESIAVSRIADAANLFTAVPLMSQCWIDISEI